MTEGQDVAPSRHRLGEGMGLEVGAFLTGGSLPHPLAPLQGGRAALIDRTTSPGQGVAC
jgi:hypothetical protein